MESLFTNSTVWGWVLVCSRFFESSHFSLPPTSLLAWPALLTLLCGPGAGEAR